MSRNWQELGSFSQPLGSTVVTDHCRLPVLTARVSCPWLRFGAHCHCTAGVAHVRNQISSFSNMEKPVADVAV